MHIGCPRELHPGENRVAMTPTDIKKLVRAGAEALVEAGSGVNSGFSDQDYENAGAEIVTDRNELLVRSDVILRLRKPEIGEVGRLKMDMQFS